MLSAQDFSGHPCAVVKPWSELPWAFHCGRQDNFNAFEAFGRADVAPACAINEAERDFGFSDSVCQRLRAVAVIGRLAVGALDVGQHRLLLSLVALERWRKVAAVLVGRYRVWPECARPG